MFKCGLQPKIYANYGIDYILHDSKKYATKCDCGIIKERVNAEVKRRLYEGFEYQCNKCGQVIELIEDDIIVSPI